MASYGSAGSNGKIKYPPSFYNYSSKLNLKRINKPILQLWITNEITSLLGFEDEIVTNTVINLFGLSTLDNVASNADDNNNISSQQMNEMIDPKQAHVVLSGFFNDDVAFQFCIKLWDYMIDASQQATGIPRQIIEAKKLQLQQEKEQQALATTSASQPQHQLGKHTSSQNSEQHQPRKRRNRWDNNDMPAADNHHIREHHERPNMHHVVPPDELPSHDSNTNNTTIASRDEYGRIRKLERERSRDDRYAAVKEKEIKHSSDHPRRRFHDDVDDVDYNCRRDDERHHSRRSSHHDRSSLDQRKYDRHDDDYYNDKHHHKRKRQY
jgi:PWI domain